MEDLWKIYGVYVEYTWSGTFYGGGAKPAALSFEGGWRRVGRGSGMEDLWKIYGRSMEYMWNICGRYVEDISPA